MGIVQDELQKIDGFLVSIKKNPDNDTYEFEIGIPIKWQYKSNEFINISELWTSEDAVCLKLSTDDEQVTSDDFINFIGTIIDLNLLIEEENKKLNDELEKRKNEMEELITKKTLEFEQLKKNSIISFNKEKSTNKKESIKLKKSELNNEKDGIDKDNK